MSYTKPVEDSIASFIKGTLYRLIGFYKLSPRSLRGAGRVGRLSVYGFAGSSATAFKLEFVFFFGFYKLVCTVAQEPCSLIAQHGVRQENVKQLEIDEIRK